MRWTETCTLVAKTYEPDDEGVMRVTDSRREVFCNSFSVGANTWSSMYEIGISVVAEIQVRTCDYQGERDVLYRGEWLSVEIVKEQGDFTRLTLRHQRSDTDDDPDYGADPEPTVPDDGEEPEPTVPDDGGEGSDG